MAKIIIVAGRNRSLINFRGDLIKEWLNLGHEVIAVAPGQEVKEKVNSLGAKYIPIPLSRTGLNPLKDANTLFAIIRVIKKERPDYLFLYTIKPVIYGSLAAYFYKTCKVYSMITGLGYVFTGGTYKHKLIKLLAVYLYKVALARNEKVFFQNPDDAASFSDLNLVKQNKTIIINGSGVNLQHYNNTPVLNGPITFLLIARLLKDKGIIEYAEAARLIKEKYPDAIFNLVGGYDENPSAIDQDEVETWVKEGIIEYLGKQDDVRPSIAKSSVYVLPSYREGIPRTVLEAMSMGRPVITTDAPGCRETVKEGINGFLVPVKDSQALAGAMERFIKEPELIQKMGQQSRKIAEEKYDVHKVNKVINKAMGLI